MFLVIDNYYEYSINKNEDQGNRISFVEYLKEKRHEYIMFILRFEEYYLHFSVLFLYWILLFSY